ncbi:unnamed protein product [Effrenium voratum]|nr:unnamed protein product [Effrenium voratum]
MEDDAMLSFLMQADVRTRAIFFGTVLTVKSVAWAMAVTLAAAQRPRYAPLLYGPLARRFQHQFPRASAKVSERLASLTSRAGATRSAQLLGRLLRVQPEDLAPAVAEATLAFRFVWPLWFPVQCWMIMRVWQPNRKHKLDDE